MPSETTSELLDKLEQQRTALREVSHPILDRVRALPSHGIRLESLYAAILLLEELETAVRAAGIQRQSECVNVIRTLNDLDAYRKTLPEVP